MAVNGVLRLAVDGDLDAGMDPLWDPCAQAAVCRAKVTACWRITEVAREVPPNLCVAGGSARHCEISGVASAAVVVVVAVTVRVVVGGSIGLRTPWGGPGGNHVRGRVLSLDTAIAMAMDLAGLSPALAAV